MKKLTIAFSLSLAFLLGAFLHTGKAYAVGCSEIELNCDLNFCFSTGSVYCDSDCNVESYDGLYFMVCGCTCYSTINGELVFSGSCPYNGACSPLGGGGDGGGVETPDLDKTDKIPDGPIADDPDQLTN